MTFSSFSRSSRSINLGRPAAVRRSIFFAQLFFHNFRYQPLHRTPACATSRTSRELTYEYLSAGIINTVSSVGSSLRFISAFAVHIVVADGANPPQNAGRSIDFAYSTSTRQTYHADVFHVRRQRSQHLQPLGHAEGRTLLRVAQDRDTNSSKILLPAESDRDAIGGGIERPG